MWRHWLLVLSLVIAFAGGMAVERALSQTQPHMWTDVLLDVRSAGLPARAHVRANLNHWSPGGQTGWHSHPGPAVVLIRSGELTFYDGDDESCSGRTFSAGQALIDPGQGHVHYAVNHGTTPAEVWVTYFDVPPGTGGMGVRDDAPAPGNCPF